MTTEDTTAHSPEAAPDGLWRDAEEIREAVIRYLDGGLPDEFRSKGTAPGQYRATMHFSMGGPWRSTAPAAKAGQTGTTTLNLNAR